MHSTMARHLLDLPEELLLEIMKHLDPTSLQCLRRADRIFLRLFSDPCFRRWHYSPPSKPFIDTPRFPWIRGSPDFENQAYTKTFRYLIQKDKTDRQCLQCQISLFESPRKPAIECLFCTTCLVDHPTVFFSAEERRKNDREVRTCIGHQGHVRLCDHLVITWKMVTDGQKRLVQGGPENENGILVKTCRHPSHVPIDHGVEGYHDGINESKARPTAILRWIGGCTVLCLTWTGHLHLPDMQNRLSADTMETCLRGLRKGAGEYIVPQAAPGKLPEMRCFDPNNCSCLDFGDKYPANSRWALIPGSGSGRTTQCCRNDPSRQLLPLTPLEASGNTPLNEIQRGKTGAHGTSTLLSFAFGAEAGWTVTFGSCPSISNCLEVSYKRTITCAATFHQKWRTVDYSWLEALAPSSFDQSEQSTKSSLWCRNQACTNYYRYLERPIVRKCAAERVYDFYPPMKNTPGWRIRGKVLEMGSAAIREQDRIEKELADGRRQGASRSNAGNGRRQGAARSSTGRPSGATNTSRTANFSPQRADFFESVFGHNGSNLGAKTGSFVSNALAGRGISQTRTSGVRFDFDFAVSTGGRRASFTQSHTYLSSPGTNNN